MSTTLLRMLFAAIFAVTGFLLGHEAFVHLIALHVASEIWLVTLTILVPVVGAVAGVFVAPLAQILFERQLADVERTLDALEPPQIVGGAIGLVVGLLVAFLVKGVLLEFASGSNRSANYVANVAYLVISVFAAYLGARVGAKQRIRSLETRPVEPAVPVAVPKIVDTSVIVDGRVLEIVRSGFLEAPLVLPRFVLRELQMIADSADGLKRTRGRRGLEVLAKLQELVHLEIDESDPDVVGVDAKLVRLCRDLHGKLVTNDFNLNRVAQVEGVTVLNVNELAGAVKPALLPGEELHVAIVRDGKEPHQGVGYLDDGTMIVVENGRRLIGEDTDVQVTSVLQTVAGRMIFAKLKRQTPVA